MPRGAPLDVPVPIRGVRFDLPTYRTPEGFLAMGTNVVSRHGVLIPRPGLAKLFTTGFGEQVMGGMYYKLNNLTEKVIAGGLTKIKVANFSTSTWDDLTPGGNPLTGTGDDQVRFLAWPEGGVTYALALNNVNTPKEWNGVAATYSDLTGISQWTTGKDWTITANRIAVINTVESAIRNPVRVRFSDFNTRSAWTSTNFVDLADTNDAGVAIRALTRTAFAAYKDQSEWIGVAQTGTFPFRVELQDTQPGPASPAAVVERFGVHYYLGQDASFYSFDGVRATHIGDPIRKKVQANINYTTIGRSHGVWRLTDRSFYWFFPTTGNNPTAAVSFNQDRSEWQYHELGVGIEVTASWPFKLIASLSWDTLPIGWTWDTIDIATYPSWDSFPGTASPEELIGGSGGAVYRFSDIGNDDGSAIAAVWEMYQPFRAGWRARSDAFETFFKQSSTALTVKVGVGTTDTVATDPSYPVALESTFDVSVDARHLLDVATAANTVGTATPEAQVLAVKHTVNATAPWEWRGGVLYTDQALVN